MNDPLDKERAYLADISDYSGFHIGESRRALDAASHAIACGYSAEGALEIITERAGGDIPHGGWIVTGLESLASSRSRKRPAQAAESPQDRCVYCGSWDRTTIDYNRAGGEMRWECADCCMPWAVVTARHARLLAWRTRPLPYSERALRDAAR